MSAALDQLRRELNALRAIVRAQQSGIPTGLAVLAKGYDGSSPERIEKAVQRALEPYGISTHEEAEAAGCRVTVCALPWLDGRDIGATSRTHADILANTGKESLTDIKSVSVNRAETMTDVDSTGLSTEQHKSQEAHGMQPAVNGARN